MKTMIYLLACLLAVASGSAFAIDPDDEDASYLPQQMLDQMVAINHKYGYDKTFFMNCVAAGHKNAKGHVESNRMELACRISATPRKCRDVSPMPHRGKSESPQQICVTSCKLAGKAAGDDGCALN